MHGRRGNLWCRGLFPAEHRQQEREENDGDSELSIAITRFRFNKAC